MTRSFVLSLSLLAACSSFDDDVFPHVTSATLAAAPAQPTALATVDVTVKIVAGSRADRSVTLGPVRLEHDDGMIVHELALAFPADATLAFHAGETKTVTLVNIGTTNADLVPLCGQTFDLAVMLDYPDTEAFTGGAKAAIPVACN